MRAPLSWIREYASIPESVTPAEIADALARVGFEVEGIEYQGVDVVGPLIVGRVISIDEMVEYKKPIRWVELDCGESTSRFVICGATNFLVGDLVVVALPGAVLAGGFAIAERETYGKISNGMICSVRELSMGDDHTGILVLPVGSAEPGDDALTLLEISDVVFDIAVNPDRGYALSIRGMAREVAAAFGVKYSDPVHSIEPDLFPASPAGVPISIDDSTAASVIFIRTLEHFNPTLATPLWIRRRIEKCGMRAISLAVDITNYVMLELGQPLHAFDASQIKGGLHIRRAGNIATLKTLDGQVRTLDPDDLLVADDSQALALAGTIGGENSEVNASTTTLAIEAARFDPLSISTNARRHKLSTEASRRFERGVDPSLAEYASARAAALLIQCGGATHLASASAGAPRYSPIVDLDPTFVSQLTGANISPPVVAEKLRLIGCDIEVMSETLWKIDPPSWRNDLHTPADLVEEVARMVGYDSIPSELPPRQVSPGLTMAQRRQRVIAQMLADQGLVEIQTFPFLSAATMKTMGYTGERSQAFQLLNPMSEDAPLLRTDLLPGLIEAAQRNLSRGARNFSLFEMGTIFRDNRAHIRIENPPTEVRPDEKIIAAIYNGVPLQPIHVGGLLVGQIENEGWHGKGRSYDWSDAVAIAESVLLTCNLEWRVTAADLAPWHPGRCAALLVDGVVVGHAGELHPRVVSTSGLPARSTAFVINISALPASHIIRGMKLGTMPVAVQDIALVVDASIPAADVEDALRLGAGELLESIELFDRYDQIAVGKISLAFTLTFRAPDRTLTTVEVSQMREAAAQSAYAKTGAVVRSA
jgi:phenylalanyl-tRNA synthetase beta chain